MARNFREFGRVDRVRPTNAMDVLRSEIALWVQKRAELALDLPLLVNKNDCQLSDPVPQMGRKSGGFGIDNGVHDECPPSEKAIRRRSQ